MKTLIQKGKSFAIEMALGLLIAHIGLVVFVVIALPILYIFGNKTFAYMFSFVIVFPFLILAYIAMYVVKYHMRE